MKLEKTMEKLQKMTMYYIQRYINFYKEIMIFMGLFNNKISSNISQQLLIRIILDWKSIILFIYINILLAKRLLVKEIKKNKNKLKMIR